MLPIDTLTVAPYSFLQNSKYKFEIEKQAFQYYARGKILVVIEIRAKKQKQQDNEFQWYPITRVAFQYQSS